MIGQPVNLEASSLVTFTFLSPDNNPILILEQGKFIVDGQEIDDPYQVYERFNDWLNSQNV